MEGIVGRENGREQLEVRLGIVKLKYRMHDIGLEESTR